MCSFYQVNIILIVVVIVGINLFCEITLYTRESNGNITSLSISLSVCMEKTNISYFVSELAEKVKKTDD